ncbi:5-oxoprolinase-like [Homalodisca vitripennis]|uniref:5-oxoprolinase-like n=1 Tax=Homalodisca vitripennis TaxID=197043 RepID=UPI001EEC9914|nr:5-oxoprolinase-like [Homalodisca vitripennis]
MHSYTYVEDELLVGKLAEKAGFDHVSLSHQVMPMLAHWWPEVSQPVLTLTSHLISRNTSRALPLDSKII